MRRATIPASDHANIFRRALAVLPPTPPGTQWSSAAAISSANDFPYRSRSQWYPGPKLFLAAFRVAPKLRPACEPLPLNIPLPFRISWAVRPTPPTGPPAYFHVGPDRQPPPKLF